MRNDERAPSKVEAIKAASRRLRGTIAESLADGTACFGEDDAQLLKFHGTYQQDDRDLRAHGTRAHRLMIRLSLPGGRLDAAQYLALDALAETYGNGTLRVTSRQSVQLHGVLKRDLKQTIAAIDRALLTTIAACGDVQRNVICCPAPATRGARAAVQELAQAIARELRPKTRAYREIWLDDERVTADGDVDEEPFYGTHYLPRKFKTAVALDTDNCVEVSSHDCGLLALTGGGDAVRAVLVLAGGGLGLTHNKPDTFAALAQPVGVVAPEHAIEAVRIVAGIFRDHGNRSDRRHARLKYLLAAWGSSRFRDEFRRRASFAVDDVRDVPRPAPADHLGLHAQDDGRWWVGVHVPNGRVSGPLRAALREAVERTRPAVRLTPQQNVLLAGLDDAARDEMRAVLACHGVAPVERLTPLARHALACPALPTCGLALAEAERVAGDIVRDLAREFAAHGLSGVQATVRVSGCPNGCPRPYTADIGIVGRRPGVYHVYVGGGRAADRLADLYAADVALPDLAAALRPLLARFAAERGPDEPLGDFWQRTRGCDVARITLSGREDADRAGN